MNFQFISCAEQKRFDLSLAHAETLCNIGNRIAVKISANENASRFLGLRAQKAADALTDLGGFPLVGRANTVP